MKTTVDIPDPLFEDLRRRAARDKTTMRALINMALRQFLDSKRRAGKPFKLKDGSFRGQGFAPGIEPGDWEQIRDLIYEGRGA
jgi:hypothetical protein